MPGLMLFEMRNDHALFVQNTLYPDAWTWTPPLQTHPADRRNYEVMVEANWECVGTYREVRGKLYLLCGQLADICLLSAPNAELPDMEIWASSADVQRVERMPVILAFTPSPAQERQARGAGIKARQAIPPAKFGELGMIATSEEERWIQSRISKLPDKSQQLQQRMSAAILGLASVQDGMAWMKQWRGVQQMARQLAADYWNASQDPQRGKTPRLPDISTLAADWAPVSRELYKITAGLRNGAEGAGKWQQSSETEAPYYREDNVTLRLLDKQPNDTSVLVENELIKKALSERPRALRPQDTTNLIALLIHWITTPAELRDAEGYLWTDASTILDLRGLEPIMRVEKGQERRAGHQQANKQAFSESIERLAYGWADIEVRITSPKKAKVQQGRLIEIKNRWANLKIQDDGSLSDEEAYKWLWRPGEHLRNITSKAIYLQQVLKYNHRTEKWPLYLAMVFTFLLGFHAKDSKTTSTADIFEIHVGKLLDRCSLLENRGYLMRKPKERLFDIFKAAMERLEADGFIASWNYREDVERLDMTKAHWADRWLGFMVQVRIGKLLLDPPGNIKGYRKIIESKNQTQRGAEKKPRISGTAQTH